MTLYDWLQRKNDKAFLEFTFLYNPEVDHKPITKEALVARSWQKVGKNLQKSFVAFSSGIK